MADSTKRRARKSKNDNPLWMHQSGQWCKKIKGRFVYFGTDLEKALALYTQERAAWEAGIDPRDGRAVSGSPTVAEVCNAYLDAQHDKLQVGELSDRTFQEQRNTCARMVQFFGRNRRVDSLRPADFAKLRTKLAGQYGPARLGNEIVRIRTVFKWAFENEVLPANVRYGTQFSKPKKEVLRRHENRRVLEALTAAEVRTLLDEADQPMKAFILLGINCGFGASDIATLRTGKAIDLDGGWITHERAKTAVNRRCPLWPETAEALREALAQRGPSHSREEEPLAFVTRFGRRWVRTNASGTPNDEIGKAFAKLLQHHSMKRPGVGFYNLRHLVQTIGEETGDLPAVASIMGHTDQTMASHYRIAVSDERLRAVTDRIRRWLFGEVDEQPAEASRLRIVG